MRLLLLIAAIALTGAWFAWLYFVSPESDQARIKSDVAGTDARVIDIKRIDTQPDRSEVKWVMARPMAVAGGKWLRIYDVTVARPGGERETYSVGVEARLFGLSDLRRIDWET